MGADIPKSVQGAFERTAHPYHMWDGIQSIPRGLEDVLTARTQGAVRKAAGAMQGKAPVHLIGCGTSYFAALASTYLFHAIPQVQSTAADAFEFFAYPPPGLENSALVGISHTGGTPAVVQSVQMARAMQAVTVGVSDVANSALERAAGFLIPSSLGVEPALPKTRSYAASLLRLYLLSVELARLQGQDVSAIDQILEESPRIAQDLLQSLEAEANHLAQQLGSPRRIIVVGGGPNLATAMEASLKLTESALVSSYAWELEEAVHGTWASTQAGDLIIILAMDGPGFTKSLRLCTGMRTIDANVWIITDTDEAIRDANHITRIHVPGVPELLTPLFSILPLYQFTYFLALSRGIQPDNMRLADPRYLKARMLMRESLP